MSRGDVDRELASFATALIEESGGLVDWQADQSCATVIAPPELAESLGQHGDSFQLGNQTGSDGLQLSLGGEFIDLASRTLRHFVPVAGTFEIPDVPVKKTAFETIVDSSFGWQNARAKVLQGSAMTMPYHAWWFHVVLQSEESWEAVIPVTLNATSKVPVALTELLDVDSLRKSDSEPPAADSTSAAALRIAEAESLRLSLPFLNRIDARRARDQKRLHDYYRALQREAGTVNRRTKITPSPEDIAGKIKAVKLELSRKLTELDERYQCTGLIRPVALAEFHIPSVGIDVEIQRKTQKRVFRLYWNALLRQMESLCCHQCHSASRNFWFSNDTVEPVCTRCHEARVH